MLPVPHLASARALRAAKLGHQGDRRGAGTVCDGGWRLWGGGARRSWDDAYEQLTYEKGACNLVQKYSPQLVRERVFSEPNATWTIMVGASGALHLVPTALSRRTASCTCWGSPALQRLAVHKSVGPAVHEASDQLYMKRLDVSSRAAGCGHTVSERAAGVQARGGEILGRLGLYFAGLIIDKVSGTDDTIRVRLRAAQLRCGVGALSLTFSFALPTHSLPRQQGASCSLMPNYAGKGWLAHIEM